MTRVFVIAEAGINHNGDFGMAQELVLAAAQVGADAVKFQSFLPEKLVKESTPKVEYQIGHSGGDTQFEMLGQLQLSREEHHALSQLAEDQGIHFLSTPFDLESLEFLTYSVGVRRIKISSGDLTNLPLLHAAGRTGRPLILSTGMATMREVDLALGAIAHARLGNSGAEVDPPGPEGFTRALSQATAESMLGDVALLQCTSEYPAPDYLMNLRAMQTLADRYVLEVGLSDHSIGIHTSIAAVALGARVLEKHLTLDARLVGPDHRASLDIEGFRDLMLSIRSVEKALGTGVKSPSLREVQNAKLVRRGLYAARNLYPGHLVTEGDIAILRPENGVSPSRYWEFVGQQVASPVSQGEDMRL